MAVLKPTGENVDRMIEPAGWPEINEDTLYNRAESLRGTLRDVTDVLKTWQDDQARIFGDQMWSGTASDAAQQAVRKNIEAMASLQHQLVKAITWYIQVAGFISSVKTKIVEYVGEAQDAIRSLREDSSLDQQERDDAMTRSKH